MIQLLWEKVWQVLIKLHIILSYGLAMPHLEISPKKMKIYLQKKDLYKNVHNSFIFNKSPKLETTQAYKNRKMNKLWYIHTMKYY